MVNGEFEQGKDGKIYLQKLGATAQRELQCLGTYNLGSLIRMTPQLRGNFKQENRSRTHHCHKFLRCELQGGFLALTVGQNWELHMEICLQKLIPNYANSRAQLVRQKCILKPASSFKCIVSERQEPLHITSPISEM